MTTSRLEWKARAASLTVALALLILLQLAVSLGMIMPHVVPAPWTVAARLPRLIVEEDVFGKVLLTLGSTMLAIAIAAAAGISIGWALHRWAILGRAYESWLGAAFSAPLVLLYPLFMVVFGRGMAPIIIMAIAAGTIPIALNTLLGLRDVPRVYLAVAQSLQMTAGQTAFKVLLPAALPTVFTGVRLGLIYIIIYIVSLEYLVDIGGLGFLVGTQYDRYDIPGMFAALACVVMTTIAIFMLTEQLERWLKKVSGG